ncbi:hypothetical protein [Ammoniphilus sp. 3BR4]|uniref:hypothetical protein n=1 Tax=Ammoniphilus sp. 3BR4 TaxID=3158265 RepID=UPI0034655137
MEKEKEELLKMVDEIQYATNVGELNTLTPYEAKTMINSLSSALGMAISHILGHHEEPWRYMTPRIIHAHGILEKKISE